MPQKYFITPAPSRGGGPTDPDYGIEEGVDPGFGIPALPPHVGGGPLPPLPGVWPPTDRPSLPIALPPIVPPGHVENPIVIPGTPEKPIHLPPGIYPPLPPNVGIEGKVAILVWVVGVGHRWAVVDTTQRPSVEPQGRRS